MKKIILIIFLAFSIQNQAQKISDSIKLFIPEIDSVCSSSFIYVPVKAVNFRNIIGLQGTLKWDPTIFKLDSIFINKSVPTFDSLRVDSNFNLTLNYITFIWVSTTNNLTLKDSTNLFRLRFKILKSSQVASLFYFDNKPTHMGMDTAADIVNLTDLASLTTNITQNGKINFVDTPTISQSGNVFTAISSCNPQFYYWYVFDCNNNLIKIDTTTTNKYISTQPTGSCFIVQCAARYGNGVSILSNPTPNILPLKLLSFTAQFYSNKVQLKWKTAYENNVSHINIQKSLSKKEFITIGKKVAGKNEYSFEDLPTLDDLKQGLFYRLEIIDKDGAKSFSEIRNIEHSLFNKETIIYPNPAKDFVTIKTTNAKEISILDFAGRTLKTVAANATNAFLNISNFSKGVYLIKITLLNGASKIEKLIID